MLHDWLLALAGAPWVYLALFALATIDGIFPPLPSESVVIALAALSVSTGSPNLALVLLAAAAGAFTGDQIAYAVGGRIDVRRIRILRNPRGQRTVDSAERALARRGPSFILAARFVPVGRMAVNLTAGAVRYPRRSFVALTALAAVAWSLYSALIGLLAGAWIQDQPLLAITVGIVGGLLSGLALDWGLRRRRTPGDRSRIRSSPRDLDLPTRRRRLERRDGMPSGDVQDAGVALGAHDAQQVRLPVGRDVDPAAFGPPRRPAGLHADPDRRPRRGPPSPPWQTAGIPLASPR